MQETKTKGVWVVIDNEIAPKTINGVVYRAAIDLCATEEEAKELIKNDEGDFSIIYDPEVTV